MKSKMRNNYLLLMPIYLILLTIYLKKTKVTT